VEILEEFGRKKKENHAILSFLFCAKIRQNAKSIK
jgi:hypothetical protein